MLGRISQGVQIPKWARGKPLEHIILRAFEIEGADVAWPFEVKIGSQVVEQIDGAIYCDGLSAIIESKDYSEPINVEPIAKLRNQLARRPLHTMGIIFARRGFTEPAKTLTRMVGPLNILLWEFQELDTAIRRQQMRHALRTKLKYAVELAMPDYNIVGENT